MKKAALLSFIFLVALCKGQSNQRTFLVGASYAYNGAVFNDYSFDDSYQPVQLFSTHFGVFISDEDVIGLGAGIALQPQGEDATLFQLAPFYRRVFPINEAFSFMLNVHSAFYFGENTTDQLTTTYTIGELALAPGLMYRLNTHTILELKVTSVGFGYRKTQREGNINGLRVSIEDSDSNLHFSNWPISLGISFQLNGKR